MLWRSQPPPPPTGLHIEINRTCNSRCKTCMMWARREDPTQLLSISRSTEIVEEFAELSPRGRVFVCGGETLLTPERLFALTRNCRTLGLGSQIATNGSLVDAAMAELLVLEGPEQIALSLNSLHAELHDYTRGRPGSFGEVTRAIRLLQAARKLHGRSTRIHVHTIICEHNYRELEDLHHFVLCELGADKLDMNLLQPTFQLAPPSSADRFFAAGVIADEEALAEILVRCDRRFGLSLNPAWIEQAKTYHRSIRESGDALRGWYGRGTPEHLCGSYEKNITVDPQGVARLCFSARFRGRRLRRRGDLRRFWLGAKDIRRKMKNCRAYCGLVDVFSRLNPVVEPAP